MSLSLPSAAEPWPENATLYQPLRGEWTCRQPASSHRPDVHTVFCFCRGSDSAVRLRLVSRCSGELLCSQNTNSSVLLELYFCSVSRFNILNVI